MKDILVHYTHPEENKDTGLYTEVEHKGYIQQWYLGPGYKMAVILNTQGKFQLVSMDKIWVNTEDMPQNK